MHSAGIDNNAFVDTLPSVIGQVTASQNGIGGTSNEEDTEMMSESDGSQSESESSDEGEGTDGAHSDAEINLDNGEYSEDELAKTLEAELSSGNNFKNDPAPAPAHDNSTLPSRNQNASNAINSVPRQNVAQPTATNLHDDLLLSESSDED